MLLSYTLLYNILYHIIICLSSGFIYCFLYYQNIVPRKIKKRAAALKIRNKSEPKTEDIRHSTLTKCLYSHSIHRLGVDSVVPDESAQNLS